MAALPPRLIASVVAASAALVVGGCTTSPYFDFAAADPQPRRVAPAPPGLVDRSRSAREDLGLLLAANVREAGVPAAAAAVLRGDRVLAQGVAGVRRRGSAVPVTLDDQWEIASCAKAMSALAIARLVEDGTLDWDRPLPAYFPGETLHPDWRHVTLRRLLTHSAGIRDPIGAFLASTYFDHGTLSARRAAFARRVLRQPVADPRSHASVYNNTDYILAAAVAETVTQTPWERLMRERVFAPLGLATAGFGPPGAPGGTDQPWGHGRYRVFQLGLGGSWPFDPGSGEADYPAMASPAGYVHLSLADWETFVALQLRGDAANPHRSCVLLNAGTFDQLHALLPGVDYAGGWFVGTRPWAKGARPGDTGRVLYHFGDNGRWTSAVWLAPEIDFAVLVVCNAGNQPRAVDKIAAQLVTRYATPRP